jgi:hypothetical protein
MRLAAGVGEPLPHQRPDWPCVLFVAAAPVSEREEQSAGSVLPGFADWSQRESLRATCFFFEVVFDEVLSRLELVLESVPAEPEFDELAPLEVPVPALDDVPLRDDVFVSFVGDGLLSRLEPDDVEPVLPVDDELPMPADDEVPAPLSDVEPLVLDGELGDIEDDDEPLMPDCELGELPLVLPLELDGEP